MKKYIILFSLVTISLNYAQDHEELHENLRKMSKIWIRNTIKNTYGDNLEFTASEIKAEKGKITFSDPRIRNSGIQYRKSICLKKKKNWLGIETCEKFSWNPNAKDLCKDLGFGELIESRYMVVNNNRNTVIYAPSDRNPRKWLSIRSASFLTHGYNIDLLYDFSCKLNE